MIGRAREREDERNAESILLVGSQERRPRNDQLRPKWESDADLGTRQKGAMVYGRYDDQTRDWIIVERDG